MTGLSQHARQTATNGLRFVYDGSSLIPEVDTNGNYIRRYLWGTDLSGSMQGAGGVGGLLAVRDASGAHVVGYDGNGNVAALFGQSGESARYEYGPFGEVIRATGTMGKNNPFRFSTKYQDDETDLLYYGYRYYSASTGRWISRDPIEEVGGMNLCGFADNSAIGQFDKDGREIGGICPNCRSYYVGQCWCGHPYIPPKPVCKDGETSTARGDIPATRRSNCSSTNFKGKFGVSGTIKIGVSLGVDKGPKWGVDVSVTVTHDYEFDIPCGQQQWLAVEVPCTCVKGKWDYKESEASVTRKQVKYNCGTPGCVCSKITP